jgi:predicted permease
MLDHIFFDLKIAVRGLQRERGFVLAAIAMLALAIGLNVTVFTVMNTMLFRGFPLVKRNDRLVYMQESRPSGGQFISYADFEEWRSQTRALEGIAFFSDRNILFSEGQGRPIDTFVATMSSNAFRLLRVAPVLGRDFTPADELPGATPVAILNFRLWNSRFNRRSDILGSTLQIDGAPVTVIGVMPEGFDFASEFGLWIPLVPTSDLRQRGATPGGYFAFGRLRDGATLVNARAELETVNQRLSLAWPATNRDTVPVVSNWSAFFTGPDAPMIYGSIWLAAWFVLLIACANVTNLSLARMIRRAHEFSIRIALGAGRTRIVSQILIESLMVAGTAGIVALWITKWSVRAWAVATASQYQILDYRLDSRTVAYLAAVSLSAAILFSVVPMMKILQLGVSGTLNHGARTLTQNLRDKRIAAALIAGQMALAIVLLCGTAVLVRSVFNITTARTGVRDPEHVLDGSVRLPAVIPQ